ncbi:MAG: hypothetical protein OXI26_11040 [bacterium]|nr:hypothetical protein [bacterium]
MSRRDRAPIFAGCLVAVLMIAAACSDDGESQVATLTDTKPPPPVETTETVSPPAAEPSPPAEPPPSADGTSPDESPAEAPPPADAPPAAEPQPMPDGDLDGAAVAALVAAADAAQSGVTSSREQLYLTMELSFGGQSMASVSDIPYALSTNVGGLTHILIDQSALAALSALEDGMGSAGPAQLPPIEAIVDENARQIYVKLSSLEALGPGERPPVLDELIAQGNDVATLWGRPGLDGTSDEILPGLGPGARPALGQFLGLLKAASDTGSVLAAQSVGPAETAGVATREYTFEVDLAALIGQWPPFLESFLAGPGGGEPPPPELFNSLTSPLLSNVTAHFDSGGLARQVGFDLDLGALLMAAFAGFGEMADAPEGAEIDFPEIEYRLAMRVEALAINDPSLAVSLPDPSQVVDVPFP